MRHHLTCSRVSIGRASSPHSGSTGAAAAGPPGSLSRRWRIRSSWPPILAMSTASASTRWSRSSIFVSTRSIQSHNPAGGAEQRQDHGQRDSCDSEPRASLDRQLRVITAPLLVTHRLPRILFRVGHSLPDRARTKTGEREIRRAGRNPVTPIVGPRQARPGDATSGQSPPQP